MEKTNLSSLSHLDSVKSHAKNQFENLFEELPKTKVILNRCRDRSNTPPFSDEITKNISNPNTSIPLTPFLTPFIISEKYRLCPKTNCVSPLNRRWLKNPKSPILSRNKKLLLDHMNQEIDHYSNCSPSEIEAKYKITKCRCGIFFSMLKNGASKKHVCKFSNPVLSLKTSKIEKKRIKICDSVKIQTLRRSYSTTQSSFSRQNRGKVIEKKSVADTKPQYPTSPLHLPVLIKSPGVRLDFSWPSIHANVHNLHKQDPTKFEPGNITIATCNIAGLNKSLGNPFNVTPENGLLPVISRLTQALGSKLPNIICLQETHVIEDSSSPLELFPGHRCFYSNARAEDSFAGIAIPYSKALAPPVDLLLEFIKSSQGSQILSTQGRIAIIGFFSETSLIIISSVYGYASSAEGKQFELLKFAFQSTQIILENKKAQYSYLTIVPILLGDINAFSFRLSRFCSHKQQDIPPPKMNLKSVLNDNNKGRLLDKFENDLNFPLKNLLDTPLMENVKKGDLPYHTNFTKDACSNG